METCNDYAVCLDYFAFLPKLTSFQTVFARCYTDYAI